MVGSLIEAHQQPVMDRMVPVFRRSREKLRRIFRKVGKKLEGTALVAFLVSGKSACLTAQSPDSRHGRLEALPNRVRRAGGRRDDPLGRVVFGQCCCRAEGGSGVDDFAFGMVHVDVATRGMSTARRARAKSDTAKVSASPQNLDFEQ
jgi:hypothetical protein